MSENKESKLIEITGLWRQQSKNGDVYLSGNMGKTKILVFINKNKKPDSKEPDYRAYIAPNEPKETAEKSSQDFNKL